MKKLFTLILFFTTTMSFAATNQPIIPLKKYYAAACKDYTGTWQGQAYDTSDLMGNGGPWPVTVNLYNEGDKIIGTVSSQRTELNGSLWAKCENGIISNLFVGKANQCGDYAGPSAKVSKNLLILQQHWENAMTGTDFISTLNKVNDHFSGDQSLLKSFPENVKSCH